MPERLPQDGCIPAYAPDHPLTCRRHHLPCTPPAGVDEPGHRYRRSEPQFQRLEQSAPRAKSSKYVATTRIERKTISQRRMEDQAQYTRKISPMKKRD